MPDIRAHLQRTFERAGGVISFDDFMALALYDPEIGYYTTQISDVGGCRGDFATSATLTKALGKSIAGWIRDEVVFHGWNGKADVIEVGAGNGSLAEGVLKMLGFLGRRKIRYHIVDVSGPLRKLQRKRLRRFRVKWHEEIGAVLDEAKGKALIISNELVDAFPAKWLCWNEDAGMWQEVWVAFDPKTGLREEFRTLSATTESEMFSAMGMPNPSNGQRIEIQPSYRKWLSDVDESWKAGSMLTVDYGGGPDEIYHRRPGGSVRGYFRQNRMEGGAVYQRVGKQDLTVDVNFTDLQKWGELLDWSTAWQGSQREFLGKFGHGTDEMATSAAGGAFRALHQRKAAKAD